MAEPPAWALANPLIRYLMAAGLTVDEAFEKAERQAIQADAPDLPMPPRAPAMCDETTFAAACRAWDPSLGPPPVRMY